MLIVESGRKIAGDFHAFFMGHCGNIEARYTTNKGILSEILVKEMRQSFERSQEFLDLDRANRSDTRAKRKSIAGH